MNAKSHTHKPGLYSSFLYADGAKQYWYVGYGDQTERLAEEGDPYEWDTEKRERVVGTAVTAAIERHDHITAVNHHLQTLLSPPSLRPWWKFW